MENRANGAIELSSGRKALYYAMRGKTYYMSPREINKVLYSREAQCLKKTSTPTGVFFSVRVGSRIISIATVRPCEEVLQANPERNLAWQKV